jgi:hypothetical protein
MSSIADSFSCLPFPRLFMRSANLLPPDNLRKPPYFIEFLSKNPEEEGGVYEVISGSSAFPPDQIYIKIPSVPLADFEKQRWNAKQINFKVELSGQISTSVSRSVPFDDGGSFGFDFNASGSFLMMAEGDFADIGFIYDGEFGEPDYEYFYVYSMGDPRSAQPRLKISQPFVPVVSGYFLYPGNILGETGENEAVVRAQLIDSASGGGTQFWTDSEGISGSSPISISYLGVRGYFDFWAELMQIKPEGSVVDLYLSSLPTIDIANASGRIVNPNFNPTIQEIEAALGPIGNEDLAYNTPQMGSLPVTINMFGATAQAKYLYVGPNFMRTSYQSDPEPGSYSWSLNGDLILNITAEINEEWQYGSPQP